MHERWIVAPLLAALPCGCAALAPGVTTISVGTGAARRTARLRVVPREP